MYIKEFSNLIQTINFQKSAKKILFPENKYGIKTLLIYLIES